VGAPKRVCDACSKAVARADILSAEPMKPRPWALVTAVARAAPAKPAMGALMMRGVVVQAGREEREGMVGWLVGEGEGEREGEMRAKAMEVGWRLGCGGFAELSRCDICPACTPHYPEPARRTGFLDPCTSSYAEAAAPVSIFTARIDLLWLGWPRQQDVLYVWEAPRHRRHITIFT